MSRTDSFSNCKIVSHLYVGRPVSSSCQSPACQGLLLIRSWRTVVPDLSVTFSFSPLICVRVASYFLTFYFAVLETIGTSVREVGLLGYLVLGLVSVVQVDLKLVDVILQLLLNSQNLNLGTLLILKGCRGSYCNI